jgi:hypothetical protein
MDVVNLKKRNVIHTGIDRIKWLNWFTLEGPTPTNISRNSEPETVINGTLASPAVAFASNVFPVPGGPANQFNNAYNYQVMQIHKQTKSG